jgi:hypothetical protein
MPRQACPPSALDLPCRTAGSARRNGEQQEGNICQLNPEPLIALVDLSQGQTPAWALPWLRPRGVPGTAWCRAPASLLTPIHRLAHAHMNREAHTRAE